jgi:hypothetical protein
MESVYHIVTIRVNETSWAHIWRLHSRYLGTGYDKRVVMHSRVTLNSYNVNAQVETSTKDSYKAKTLMGKICSGACLAQKGS